MQGWTYYAREILIIAPIPFFIATVAADGLHWVLHQAPKSRIPVIAAAGKLHALHHRFFDAKLNIDPKLARANIWKHLWPEYGTFIALTLVQLAVFSLPAIIMAVAVHTGLFALRLRPDGTDMHHHDHAQVKAFNSMLWVGPSYHYHHHLFPDRFFASFLGVFDVVFGTGSPPWRGRRITLTGASGAMGAAFRNRLERDGASVTTLKHGRDFTPGDVSGARDALANTDILILAHGAKTGPCMAANHDTFLDLIEAYRAIKRPSRALPEVWAVGSEAELHGDFGFVASLRDYAASKRAFAREAKRYWLDDGLIYRHIVPSAFTSAMGPGLISAKAAVAYALFLIRRGMTYAPVTYTGMAWANFIRFRLLRPSPRQGGDSRPVRDTLAA